MAYGSEYRSTLFEKLCVEMPQLRQLEDDVIRVTDFLMMEEPRPTTQGDTDVIWYTLFKPRVQDLVGYMAKGPSELAATTEAYGCVTDYLYHALAPSKETLRENSRADEYQRRYEDEREQWDGNLDTEPDFIGTERILQLLVSRLGLPVTEMYLNDHQDEDTLRD